MHSWRPTSQTTIRDEPRPLSACPGAGGRTFVAFILAACSSAVLIRMPACRKLPNRTLLRATLKMPGVCLSDQREAKPREKESLSPTSKQ